MLCWFICKGIYQTDFYWVSIALFDIAGFAAWNKISPFYHFVWIQTLGIEMVYFHVGAILAKHNFRIGTLMVCHLQKGSFDVWLVPYPLAVIVEKCSRQVLLNFFR